MTQLQKLETLVQQKMRMDIHEQQPQIDFFQRIVDKYHNNPLTLDDYLIENFVK